MPLARTDNEMAGCDKGLCFPSSSAISSIHSHFPIVQLQKSTSLVAQTVKRLPAMQETRVRFLGREDPLEKEMAIHSSTLAWKIPGIEEPDRLQSRG